MFTVRLLLCILFMICFSQIGSMVYAQSDRLISDKISDCDGAVSILEPGSFSMQFTGKAGLNSDFNSYPTLSKQKEKNSVWASFTAPHDGTFLLDGTAKQTDIHLLIFQTESEDICGDIFKGIAEIKRTIISGLNQDFGLSYSVTSTYLYPLKLTKGETILLCFNTQAKGKPIVNLTIDFEAAVISSAGAKKEIDQRNTVTDKVLKIELRDAETGDPVIGKLTLEGMKDITLQYTASDFMFSITKLGKIIIKVDAAGYFFVDREEPITSISTHQFVIYLEKLEPGKILDMSGIEFQPGSSEFMPSAEIKLRRLKDFLALNAVIKVEIGGHVTSNGENTFMAQKISEARAKRVVNYLIDNGISKERLTSNGYGNTLPRYPKAQFDWQEQANRRVEVKIL